MLNVAIKSRYDSTGSSYIKLYLEDGRVVDEHRYIMTQSLGRELEPWEVVHHKDEDGRNNDLSNLEVQNKVDHARYHASKRGVKMVVLNCAFCGTDFERDLRNVKSKVKSGQTRFYCNRQCMGAAPRGR